MIKMLKIVDWYIHLTMVVSIGLIIASFVVPPTGVIDGSVLAGVGELGTMASVFTFLAKLPEYIKAGMTARVVRGTTTLEVSKNTEDNLDKEENEND